MTTTHIMSDETGQQILAQLTAISQALDDGALTNQQISTVLSDGTPTGAGFLDGGGLKAFFDGLKTKFAAIAHNHSGDALTPASVTATGKVKAATIEDSGGTLAALRESVSKYIEVPFSDFTFNDGRFETTNYSVPNGYTLVGMLVYPTNGGAIMQGYAMNGYLRVVGWIPVIAQNIDSSYRFRCFLACSKTVQ